MAICDNCGGDPDCTHKPELSAQLATQAARIEALEGALRSIEGNCQEYKGKRHNVTGVLEEIEGIARRILAEGGVKP